MAVVARIRALTKKPTRLQALANNLLGEVVQVMDRQLDDAVDIMKTEPPPKPDSTYVRTHNYQRSWKRSDVRLRGSGLVGTIRNDMRYAVFVGGDESGTGQLDMHASTGWPLLATALRDAGNVSFSEKLRKAVHEAIEG